MRTARSPLLLASITWLVFASAAHGETIDRVKDLYRSAAYEEALAVLDQMAKEPAPTNPVEAREYRLLCLIALERRTEARDAIASMVNAFLGKPFALHTFVSVARRLLSAGRS